MMFECSDPALRMLYSLWPRKSRLTQTRSPRTFDTVALNFLTICDRLNSDGKMRFL